MKARRLKTIARYINENSERLGGIRAVVEQSYRSTDRKIPGTRLRRPGRGRTGNRIRVFDREGRVLLDHNAAETYRHNGEVEEWLARWEEGQRKIRPVNPGWPSIPCSCCGARARQPCQPGCDRINDMGDASNARGVAMGECK